MYYSGLLGSFYKGAEWIYRFAFTNSIWVIANLPIWFLVFNLIITDKWSVIIPLLILILLLLPFTTMPATVALSYVLKSIFIKEEENLFREFKQGYQQLYMKSVKIGVIYVGVLAVLIIDLWYATTYHNDILRITLFFIGFIGFVYMVYVTVLLSYKKITAKTVWKKAAQCMGANLFLSLSLGIISIVYFYLVFQWLPVVLIFFSISILQFLALLVIFKQQSKG